MSAPIKEAPLGLDARKPIIPWTDGMRGLAALTVVVAHSLYLARGGHLSSTLQWSRWVMLGATFAVPMFLFLSGYLLGIPPANNGMHLNSISKFFERRATGYFQHTGRHVFRAAL